MIHKDPYIDLLVRSLIGQLSDAVAQRSHQLITACQGNEVAPNLIPKEFCAHLLMEADREFREYLEKEKKTASEFMEMDADELFSYLNWMNPLGAPHTMCGIENAQNIVSCVDRIFKDKIPGDFIETGVWKGGMTVLMRGLLKAHGSTDRNVWVADSFEGLPKPDPEKDLKDAIFWFLMKPINQLTIPFEYVHELFLRYGLLDNQVKFLKGWFCDTLPEAPIKQLALLRMDGDLYESTKDALVNLYPKLSVGGYVIVDDYGVPCGCRQAVDEYREKYSIKTEMLKINTTAVYWRKE